MKVLFIGGTGIISSACAQQALEQGIDLYLLNRGRSFRPSPPGAKALHGDIRDPNGAAVLAGHTFDVVVNWIAFTPQHIETDLALFHGRTGQYIFISSASAYHKPVRSLPITESTPLHNPFWAYSRDKIACEERLLRAYRDDGFPMTIVRPSHTYDRTLLPMHGRYTMVDRMRRGLPVIVHGDGTSLWVLTHHRDFARGFTGLLGNPAALGEAFHITSDEALPWNEIYRMVGRAAGVEPHLVHVPSDFIAAINADFGSSLLGDKAHSVIFDNSKIKRLVPGFQATIPFHQGVREIMAYYDGDPARQTIDELFNQLLDRILDAYGRAWPDQHHAE
jgi:nucleoside-diphosphate-sugar epimerase